jgi:transcriptional regulator, ArsR family
MSAPIPSTHIFLESLRLSSKQRLVFDVINQFPEGARIPDVTEALGIHVNTARGHINELEEKGAVKRVKVSPAGPGRPYVVYKARVPDNRTIAEEYITLINTLCNQLDALSDDAQAVAEAVGEAWGAELFDTLPSEGEDALGLILEKFRLMGFDPTMNQDDTIIFSSCPFVSSGRMVNPLVCAMHRTMLSAAGKPVGLTLELTPKSGDGACQVVAQT